uniref:THAP-type domain-containing protein n=1 Tax=Sinocyclocheilus anshuiensis TaxID=1608454 RepID=A0A671SGA3_9TELE
MVTFGEHLEDFLSHNRSGKKLNNWIRFFHFPTCKQRKGKHVEEVTRRRRMAWIAATRRKDISYSNISKSMKVCSLHFQSGQPAYEMFDTHPDWAPSLLLGHNEVKVSDQNRFARHLRRHGRSGVRTGEKVDDRVQTQDDEEVQLKEKIQQDVEERERTRQDDDPVQNPYDHGVQECELCQSRHDEINLLLNENRQLKKLCHLSGFIVPHHAISILLVLPLRKLSVLYSRLSPLVHWPDRESLRVSMPHQFVEAFGNRVAAIVDCFDVFIERPSNLQARAQTFSSYKHSHTLKYLISITPQGVISFISKGWGGRTSDKRITENCGFLDKLLPGDLVLADRGFDIKKESVGLMCAEVKVPAFTKGQQQLEAKDVEETRRIAHLRTHVERIIGVVRNKYKILSSTIPISMVLPCEDENVTFLDKVVTVCCALTNVSKCCTVIT